MKRISTVFDYMDWRGDLTFAQSPFNEVDSVILSMVCFLDFQGIVPAPGQPGSVTLQDAMAQMPMEFTGEHRLGAILPDDILGLAHTAAQCPRYGDARLFAYENVIDEAREMQFAAMTFRLSDDTLLVAYRGTDDTIVGWKEDFNMTFMSHVPAQERAAAYLNHIAQHHKGEIRTTGHSKGGNLAIWAAVNCDRAVRNRIIRAYSNDGPGFTRELLESDAYREMRDRCITFIPQSSLVGMLMEHDENYRIIYSAKSGMMQHDPFSWSVCRNHYEYLDERSSFGQHSDAAIRKWLGSMTPAEKQALGDDLFEILESTGAKTLTELSQAKGVGKSIRSKLSEYDKPRRMRIARLLGRFVAAQVETAVPETPIMDRLAKLESRTPITVRTLGKREKK